MKKTINILIIIWRIIYPAAYSIVLLALAAYALISNDQGRDFFVGVAFYGVSIFYILKTSSALVTWCLLIWYTNRMVLQIKEIDVPDNEFTRKIIQWLPRILSLIPLLIVSIALFKGAEIIRVYKWDTLIVYTLLTIAIGVFLIWFYIKRPEIARKMRIVFEQDEQRYSPNSTSITELMSSKATKIAVWLIIGINSLLFILFLLPVNIGFARLLQPATVVFCGFIFFTVLSAYIILKFKIRQSPAFFIMLLVIVLFSTNNDNSSIRQITSESPVEKRENIETNFRHWIQQRIPAKKDPSANQFKDSVYPIIIVAAEGGGIRGTSWTAQVLKKLNDLNPSFTNHVYAISGVSGGGVGSVFYTSWYHDRLKKESTIPGNNEKIFENAVSADFLSDLTAAFIFSDNLQRIIPFPILPLNRNRKLEDSWGLAYRHNLLSETMDASFLDIWYKDDVKKYSIPNLFINGAIAETGQKAITSNLALHSPSMNVFKDDVDVLKVLGSDIPAKTAASLCARFPVITSGALLKENGQRAVGHIIDGGYKENSGIETAWQLVLGLNPFIRSAELELKCRLPIYIIFIQNSTDAKSISDSVPAAKVLPDISTILPGFLNAWDRRTLLYKNITSKLFSDTLLNDRYKYFEIRINNSKGLLPLGWSLSDSARSNIREQVNAIKAFPSNLEEIR